MKYLLALLLLLPSLSSADHTAKPAAKVYLYILMNGERHKVVRFQTEYETLSECEHARRTSERGGHTRAVIYCGSNLTDMDTGLKNGRKRMVKVPPTEEKN